MTLGHFVSAEDESYNYPYEPSLHLQQKFQQQQNLSNPSTSSNNLYDQADPKAMKGQILHFDIIFRKKLSFLILNIKFCF